MKKTKKKTLTIGITGAAGFIGSNLCQKLATASNHKIIGVDNLSRGDIKNLEGLQKSKNFHLFKIDVCDLQKLSKVLKGVDVIVHLAAYKIPRFGDRLDVLINNTKTTQNVLEIAKNNKATVIFISSSDIYGKNPKLPFKEDADIVLGPTDIARWSYAVSKIFDEHLCFGYSERYTVPFVILRLFNVYGPRQNRNWLGGAQSEFIDALLSGQPLKIHGTGKQTRSYTYVEDIADAIIKCIDNPKVIGKVINIGNTTEIAVDKFASIIAKTLKKPLRAKKISHLALTGRKYDEVQKRRPEITLAKKIIKWKPTTPLSVGLKNTINWHIKNPL